MTQSSLFEATTQNLSSQLRAICFAEASPRQRRAIANYASKGLTVQLSSWPKVRFMNRDTQEIEEHHIADLLAEYDQDRRESARMMASSRRLVVAGGRDGG